MKKKIALILSVVMLITMLLPIQGFAAEDDKGLEKAIKVAKEKFTIPDNFKFNYNVSTQDGKNVWYLNWNSEDGINGGISVSVDSNGKIKSYDNYKPYVYPRQRKFPKISKQEALTIANEFIKNVNPDILSNIKYQEDERNTLTEYDYYLNYARIENGIAFYNNNINMRINSETGEVLGYYANWNEDLEFPAPDKIISIEEAQDAYREKLGLRLVYNYVVEDEKVKVYAVYTPKYNNYSCFIDAFTGEKIQLEESYYPYYEGAADMANKTEIRFSSGAMPEPVLTPEEIKAIEEVSKLRTIEQVEKEARTAGVLELTSEFKLTYSNLSRSWPVRDDFNWYLNFTKEPTEKDKEYKNVSVSIDAKTGEIRNFHLSMPYREGDAPKYDEEASKVAVEKFLKEFVSDKFSETEYDDTYSNVIRPLLQEGQSPREYFFNYIRKVDGVAFPGNSINVRYDAVNGKIVSYNINWFNVEFPAVDKIIPIDNAYEKLYSAVGLELQYKTRYPDYYRIQAGDKQNKNEVRLVYSLKTSKPAHFDANTGTQLDYSGKPYEEVKPVKYTDITDHFAEKQINALAEYGIALEGTEFKPNDNIIQKDFFILFSKVLGNYYGPIITQKSSNKEVDSLYNFLIREGVIKSEEKSPDSTVTREEAVKFIIRGLKYNEVADIEGIYKTSFKDEDKINPELLGYVAIANGLKIVNGSDGFFNPDSKLTRAETAVVIYNYLQK